MPMYRKNAVVEARQWNPDDPTPVLGWLDEAGAHFEVLTGDRLGIGTLESGEGLDRHAGKPGDFIIRGAKGEFYACDRQVFEQTYDLADGDDVASIADELGRAALGLESR